MTKQKETPPHVKTRSTPLLLLSSPLPPPQTRNPLRQNPHTHTRAHPPDALAALSAPHSRRVVVGARHRPQPPVAHRHRAEPPLVALELMQGGAGGRVPNDGCCVMGGADDAVARSKELRGAVWCCFGGWGCRGWWLVGGVGWLGGGKVGG